MESLNSHSNFSSFYLICWNFFILPSYLTLLFWIRKIVANITFNKWNELFFLLFIYFFVEFSLKWGLNNEKKTDRKEITNACLSFILTVCISTESNIIWFCFCYSFVWEMNKYWFMILCSYLSSSYFIFSLNIISVFIYKNISYKIEQMIWRSWNYLIK